MADDDIEQIGDAATRTFEDLNPAIQAMVMLYLTGNIPGRVVITDETLRRSPILNASDKVEMVFNGCRSEALQQTEISVAVFINGKPATPNPRTPF